MLNIDTASTCPHNMVNFSLLTAEICWRVWGTPANFNGFRVLAALLHGTLVVGVSQAAALNRGRHLYLAGRPSRWALAHILVSAVILITVPENEVELGSPKVSHTTSSFLVPTDTVHRRMVGFGRVIVG